MTTSTPLKLNNVSVGYQGKPVLENVNLSLKQGEIASLLGPSGCGKSSLLRAIAGFEPVMQGSITINHLQVAAKGFSLPPEQRKTGMVFQDFALFPHLSVRDNIGFGLSKASRTEKKNRIDQLLDLIGLKAIQSNYPHQLSGGQQQRVALARAMAPRPDILLLDEPFSSMDTDMRTQLAHEVGDMLRHDEMTAILVTHDQHEAYAMADHIGVIGEGRLHQWGKPYDLYHRPADRFVADFIGEGVFIPGELVQTDQIQTELGRVRGKVSSAIKSIGRVELLLRPDDIIHDDNSELKAEIIAKDFRGPVYIYTLKLHSQQKILCLVQSHHDHKVGEKLGIRLDAEHLAVFPRQ